MTSHPSPTGFPHLRAVAPSTGPSAAATTTQLQRTVDWARRATHAQFAELVVVDPDGTPANLVHSGHQPRRRLALADPTHPPEPVAHAELSLLTGSGTRVRLCLVGRVGGGTFSATEIALAEELTTLGGPWAQDTARAVAEQQAAWLRAGLALGHRLLDPAGSGEDPLPLVAETVRDLAEACVVAVLTPSPHDRRLLRVSAVAEAASDAARGRCPVPRRRLAQQVLDSGRSQLVPDETEAEPQPSTRSTQPAGPTIVVPLPGAGGCRGVLQITRTPGGRRFTPADLEAAEELAQHVGRTLDLRQDRETSYRLRLLDDRERIARDLHDQVIQRLFASGLRLQSAAGESADPGLRRRLQETIRELDGTVRQIRTSIFALKSSGTADRTVRRVVMEVVDGVSAAFRLHPEIGFQGLVDGVVDAAVLEDVEAVVRESLTNAGKHAHAHRVRVVVTATDDRLTVVVEDDGVGLGGSSRSSGLANLRCRAERHGGELSLEEPPGGGVRLSWGVPLS